MNETYKSRKWTIDSRVVNKGSSSFFPALLHCDVNSFSIALEAVKYSTEWLRNLVFFVGTLALIHLATAISSFVGLSAGCIASAS